MGNSNFLLILFIIVYNPQMIKKKVSLRKQFTFMSSIFTKENDIKI